MKNHRIRKEAQLRLRHSMALWGGWRLSENEPLHISQRRFFHRFGIDILNAQALSAKEAAALDAQIVEELATRGVIPNAFDTTTGEIHGHS